jgi:nicotinamidase-related amidase
VDVLRSQVEEREVLPKMAFSCAEDVAIADAIAASGRRNIVICGIEAHVCVLQSALGFLRDGYGVCVTADAVSSRRADSRETALKRMASNGVEIVTTEMVVFEWLHHAGTPEFKALSKLIK